MTHAIQLYPIPISRSPTTNSGSEPLPRTCQTTWDPKRNGLALAVVSQDPTVKTSDKQRHNIVSVFMLNAVPFPSSFLSTRNVLSWASHWMRRAGKSMRRHPFSLYLSFCLLTCFFFTCFVLLLVVDLSSGSILIPGQCNRLQTFSKISAPILRYLDRLFMSRSQLKFVSFGSGIVYYPLIWNI